jgi:hypothetical protein
MSVGLGSGGNGNGNGEAQTLTSPNNQNQMSNFFPPLSIDFVCKLKRPTHMPIALEFNRNQTFQGTLLEDWLMQSLDDHLANQQQFFNANKHNYLSVDASTNTNTDMLNSSNSKKLISNSVTSLLPDNNQCGISVQSTATNSATSLVVVDTLSYSYIPNASSTHDIENEYVNEQENQQQLDKMSSFYKNLNSDSYKIAIENTNESSDLLDLIDTNNNSSNKNAIQTLPNINNNNNQNLNASSSYGYKRQEANFYVQQILTNLLALGVLEFESGFENAINKTFKVLRKIYISFF